MRRDDGWQLYFYDAKRPTVARKRFLRAGKLAAPEPGQPAEVRYYPDGAVLCETFVTRTGAKSVWHRHDGTVIDTGGLLAHDLLQAAPEPVLELAR
jgi:hypothetical protein